MTERRRLKSAVLTAMILFFSAGNCLSAFACAPEYDKAVFVSWSHPDLPLSDFAAGNLGVIQPGWARSYLCVAYRYLTGPGLNKIEQASARRIWIERLQDEVQWSPIVESDPASVYAALRSKVLKIKLKEGYDLGWDINASCARNEIGRSAVAEAARVLAARIKKYGQSSREVREWLKGQDCVFALSSSKCTVPPPLPPGFDGTLREDRTYQRAAANFYGKDYEQAAKLFAGIAADKNSARRALASYLVARCKVKEYFDGKFPVDVDKEIETIEMQARKETGFEQKENLFDLVSQLRAANSSDESRFPALVQAVSQPGLGPDSSAMFGRQLADLTYIISERRLFSQTKEDQSPFQNQVQQFDLTTWLRTVSDHYDFFILTEAEIAQQKRQYPGDNEWLDEEEKKLADHRLMLERNAAFALAKWRQNHKLHWLLAVMLCGGLRQTDRADALAAARQISPQSPAFMTASFYVVDALIAQNKLAAARERLKQVSALKGPLPPSATNLFKSQELAVATTVDQYLNASIMRVSVATSDGLLLPSAWQQYEKRKVPGPLLGGWDEEVALDLDYNLPFSLWLKLARRRDIPANLHARIVCATWLRAVLLGKSDCAGQLEKALVQSYPALAAPVARYNAASSKTEKQYALAGMILENYGIAPYVRSGLPRFAMAINEFNFYQKNFWLPFKNGTDPKQADQSPWGAVVGRGNSADATLMAGYYERGVSRLLSAREKAEAARERMQMEKCHPSILLGEAVLNQAKSGKTDAELSHRLYKIVKLPLWSGSSSIGTTYSRAALKVLKSRYKGDKWAGRVQYAY